MKKILIPMAALAVAAAAHADIGDAIPAQAFNKTVDTECSEHNNVNIPLLGNVKEFVIEAIHPTYEYEEDNCAPNFENCPEATVDHEFEDPGTFKLFDDFDTVVEVVRDEHWWQPDGMTVTVDNGDRLSNIHYVRVYERMEGADRWPQFFVLYSDGNMRLSPQPPAGVSNVCFGSSVIVGPASMDDRPMAQIGSIDYFSETKRMIVNYKDGGSAELDFSMLNSRIARVNVRVDYPVEKTPFATFRSMHVKEGVADVDHIWWKDIEGETHNKAVGEFDRGEGTEWVFYRRSPSVHNTSGPNIRIRTIE